MKTSPTKLSSPSPALPKNVSPSSRTPSIRQTLKRAQQTALDEKQVELDVRERDRQIEQLKHENAQLLRSTEAQQSTINNLSEYNTHLTASMESLQKEYGELDQAFKESVQLIRSLHVKLKQLQEEASNAQLQHVLEVESLQEELQRERSKSSELETKLSSGVFLDSSQTSSFHRDFHRHMRDNYRLLAEKLVESLVLLEKDLDAHGDAVKAIRKENLSNDSPFVTGKSRSIAGFTFGVPSKRHPMGALAEHVTFRGNDSIIDDGANDTETENDGGDLQAHNELWQRLGGSPDRNSDVRRQPPEGKVRRKGDRGKERQIYYEDLEQESFNSNDRKE